jgi:hypothetical protein
LLGFYLSGNYFVIINKSMHREYTKTFLGITTGDIEVY